MLTIRFGVLDLSMDISSLSKIILGKCCFFNFVLRPYVAKNK